MQRALLAEFDCPETCAQTVRSLRKKNFAFEVYMPYPAKEVEEALEAPRSPLPAFVLVAGLAGASLGYLILWYTNVLDYPLNVGGRPTHAIPSFIPIAFETMVLFAAVTAFAGGLVLGGLPRLNHPLDVLPEFDRVSVDRFALVVDKDLPHASLSNVEDLLRAGGAIALHTFDLEQPEPEATPG